MPLVSFCTRPPFNPPTPDAPRRVPFPSAPAYPADLSWVYTTLTGYRTITDNHCCAVRLSSYQSAPLDLRYAAPDLFLQEDSAEREET